jgi:hypothetical protein
MKSVADMLKERDAKKAEGEWVPACNRTEVPFMTRTGFRLLYCWQPSTGKHAYLNCDTDIILSDEDAARILATS